MQGALTWRQLAFFEKEKVQQVNSSSSPNWLKSIDEITSATSGKGLLYFGDSTGKITIVNNQMEVELEFQAYSNKISQLKVMGLRSLLLSIGSDENLIPTIKVWNLDKIDKSTKAPTLTRTTKIQHGNRVFPVTCFAVLEALTQVAVGFENGLVILIRGDISRERFTSQKVLHEGSACITGLGFHEENSKVTLYIVTLNEILTAVTTTKDVKKNVLDELGCDFGCAILTTVDNRHEMVIGRNEAIYYYGIDGRGPCAIIDGEKTFLSLFRQYLIVVSKERKQKSVQDSNNTSQQVTTEISDTSSGTYLSIYDLKNKFIAYVGNFPLNEGEANGSPIFAVIGEWGELFVITKNKRIFRLKEIDLSSKLEILFKKNMYGLAIAIVTSLQGENNINSIQKTSENIELQELTSTANFSGDYGTVVEICRRYGDWLYLKGEFDAAIQQYLKTIGYLEPSYVIRKFLDAQRIHNLTSYLQALHEKGFGNSDHTTLLINCYTKLRDNKKLDIFLKSNTSEEWKFDVDTAIKVCRSAGYFEHALFLAQHYDQIDWYMKIQIEDLKEYRKTVAFLSKLPTSLSRAELKKYGYILVTELPMEMSEILIKLFLEIPDDEISPEEFIHLYVHQPKWCINFLEKILEVKYGIIPTSKIKEKMPYTENALESEQQNLSIKSKASLNVICDTLIELYLGKNNKYEKENDDSHLKYENYALDLFKHSLTIFDYEKSLVLCKLRKFDDGVNYLFLKLKLYKEVIQFHVEKKNFDMLIKFCKEQNNPELWIEAINCFSEITNFSDDGKNLELNNLNFALKEILSQIEELNLLTPLQVLKILSKNECITIGMIKDYIIRRVENDKQILEDDQKLIKSYQEETLKIKQSLLDLKRPVIFQVSKCDLCERPLDIPTVHFMCKHSFHQRCMQEDIKECPICGPEQSIIRDLIKSQKENANNHELYLTTLESKRVDERFNYISEMFSKNVFRKL